MSKKKIKLKRKPERASCGSRVGATHPDLDRAESCARDARAEFGAPVRVSEVTAGPVDKRTACGLCGSAHGDPCPRCEARLVREFA